jgi:hypothetical protein
MTVALRAPLALTGAAAGLGYADVVIASCAVAVGFGQMLLWWAAQ